MAAPSPDPHLKAKSSPPGTGVVPTHALREVSLAIAPQQAREKSFSGLLLPTNSLLVLPHLRRAPGPLGKVIIGEILQFYLKPSNTGR